MIVGVFFFNENRGPKAPDPLSSYMGSLVEESVYRLAAINLDFARGRTDATAA